MVDIYYKPDDEPHYYKAWQSSAETTDQFQVPNGSGLVFHADGKSVAMTNISEKSTTLAECEPYLPAYPRDVSLHTCADDNKDYCLEFTSNIKFLVDFELLKGGLLAKLSKKVGQFAESEPVVLYHDYIMWAYGLRITREQGNSYRLGMKSLDSPVGGAGNKGLSDLIIPEMDAPGLVEAELILSHSDKEHKFQLLRSTGGGYHVDKEFTEEELRHFQDGTGHLHLSLRLIVPRSFFSLDRLIDLTTTTVPSSKIDTVQQILDGKKPSGSDLIITASPNGYECCNKNKWKPVYFVHRSVFATSFLGELEVLPNGNSTIKGACDHVLRLVIVYTYGVETNVPNQRSLITLRQMEKNNFDERFIALIKKQWERAICSKALAMDRRNPSSSMVHLLHLLNLIWKAGEGVFPMAKRVAIGVLADMAHLNARSSLQEWVTESVLPHLCESGCASEHVAGILTAFHKIMKVVPGVEKKIIPLWVDYWPS